MWVGVYVKTSRYLTHLHWCIAEHTILTMDPDNFHHVNGTYGDVKYAEAWGNPDRIEEALRQIKRVDKKIKIYEAIALLEKHGYQVTPPDASTRDVSDVSRM